MNAASHRHSDFFTIVRAAVLAGCTALAGSSCVSYPPPGPEGNVFVEGNGRPRYGYGGSQSPNNQGGPPRQADPSRRSDRQDINRPEDRKPPVIRRDPNDTTVDMTPPERKLERTPEPVPPVTDAPEKNQSPSEKYTPPERTTPSAPTPPPVEKEKPAGREDLPYGTPIVGRKGFVYSPYYTTGEVDVKDISSGTKVRCPYTKKIFRVP
ncbi:MAG: hypothetical protein V4726_04105 [Verrucomicrobiota bacterium]